MQNLPPLTPLPPPPPPPLPPSALVPPFVLNNGCGLAPIPIFSIDFLFNPRDELHPMLGGHPIILTPRNEEEIALIGNKISFLSNENI